MGIEMRSKFQQEVVNALLDAKAIDLEKTSSVFAKFAEQAARDGESLVQIINHNAVWNCGYPGPVFDLGRVQINSALGGQ